MATDLSRLGIPELMQLQKDAQKRIDELRDQQAREAREELDRVAEQLAEKAGLTKAQLLATIGKGARRVKLQPRYKNPNGSETWAGRGRQPAWVQRHLDTGGKLDDLTV